MLRHALGEAFVAGQPPRAGKQRRWLMARQVPDELDVPDGSLVAVRHVEAIALVGGPRAGQGIAEPVRLGRQIREWEVENLPLPPQQRFGGLHDRVRSGPLRARHMAQQAAWAVRPRQPGRLQIRAAGWLGPPPLPRRDGAACGHFPR